MKIYVLVFSASHYYCGYIKQRKYFTSKENAEAWWEKNKNTYTADGKCYTKAEMKYNKPYFGRIEEVEIEE